MLLVIPPSISYRTLLYPTLPTLPYPTLPYPTLPYPIPYDHIHRKEIRDPFFQNPILLYRSLLSLPYPDAKVYSSLTYTQPSLKYTQYTTYATLPTPPTPIHRKERNSSGIY